MKTILSGCVAFVCSICNLSCAMEVENSPKTKTDLEITNIQQSDVSWGAGALPVAKGTDGRFYVLLGLRDDSQYWCNFGGRADEGDVFLADVAAREAQEESMGIFCISPRILTQSHYFDINLENLIFQEIIKHASVKNYRMYLYETSMIDKNRFVDRLSKVKEDTSREYQDFKWGIVPNLRL